MDDPPMTQHQLDDGDRWGLNDRGFDGTQFAYDLPSDSATQLWRSGSTDTAPSAHASFGDATHPIDQSGLDFMSFGNSRFETPSAFAEADNTSVLTDPERVNNPIAFNSASQASVLSTNLERALGETTELGSAGPDTSLEDAIIALRAQHVQQRTASASHDPLGQLIGLLSEIRDEQLSSKTRASGSTALGFGPSTLQHTFDERPRCWDHGCNGRSFENRRNYLRHVAEKRGLDAAFCSMCGATFTRRSNRDKHEKTCPQKARRNTE